MKAVILTGGKGENMRPITLELPKALLPVQGRHLIDQSIDLFYKYKTFEIWFILNHKANMILDKYPYPYIHERGHPLGTGGWLFYMDRTLFSDNFYVCNGDNVFDIDLKEMLEQHKKSKSLVTVACTNVKDVRSYGSVHIKNDKIQSFEEKAKSRIKKSGWINGGYYVFSPELFAWMDKNLSDKRGETISLEKDVFPLLAKQGLLGGYQSNGQWFDTGSIERYGQLLRDWQGIR